MNRSDRRRAWLLASSLPTLLLLVSLALVFFQVRDFRPLVDSGTKWAEIGALAVVMTAIILTGGIDLSIGSIVALTAVLVGVLWQQAGMPVGLAALLAVLLAAGCGAINGLLVTMGLSPLVATLATMAFFRGLAMTLSGGGRITGFPEAFRDWQQLLGIPTHYWLLCLAVVTGYLIIHRCRFGSWCYFLGDNPRAARFAAVPVTRVQLMLYTMSGLVAGLVGVIYTMQFNAAVPDASTGIELHVIACVVVGGTLITGGRGSIPRTLLGLIILAHLDTGLDFLGYRVSWMTAEARQVAIGLLLITVAIWNQRWDQYWQRQPGQVTDG